jgi:hypothetical protein
MKNIFLILAILLSTYTYSQKYTLLQINSEWNSANNVKLPKIKGVENVFAYLEEQSSDFKKSVKSVPVVILYKDDTPVYQWTAGISMKLEIKEEEIIAIINK